MSGKIKIGGLVLAAALGVLWAWFAYAGGPSKNPCGSHVVGVGLKAVFLPQYVDLGVDRDDPSYGYPRTWDTIIQHDVAGLPYQYGADCVYLYQDGHVIVNIDRPRVRRGTDDERYVKVWFVRKSASTCNPTPDFLNGAEVHTSAFQFRTVGEFTASRGYQDDPNVLFLHATATRLNLGTMIPEQTYYCTFLISVGVGNDPDSYRLSGLCKVNYGLLDSGNVGWEITPVHEPFWLQDVTKEGDVIVHKGVPTYAENSVNTVSLVSVDCPEFPGWGNFYVLFKLILERL